VARAPFDRYIGGEKGNIRMGSAVAHINLLAAWVGITIGFVWGFAMGLFFHRDEWLGGYGALKRRLYRLAHISLFGLALINIAFFFTAEHLVFTSTALRVASVGFLVGAISMPICCVAMAHFPRRRELFLIPVLSLVIAGACTLWEVWQR
jgi:hypothetical protein